MKLAKIIFGLSLIMFIAAFAQAETNPADVQAVKLTVEKYVQGTDTRNVDELEKVLYPNCDFVTQNKITNKTVEMNDGEFIDLVKGGKAGGWTRNVNVNSVDINGNTAAAKVEITDSKLKETSYLALIKDNGTWKIVSGVSTLETNK